MEKLIKHYSFLAGEICLVSTCAQIDLNSECIDICPGEEKFPKSILNDEYCEEINFSHHFPTGKFGYKA